MELVFLGGWGGWRVFMAGLLLPLYPCHVLCPCQASVAFDCLPLCCVTMHTQASPGGK